MESKAANIQMLYTDKRTTEQTLETVNGKIMYNMTNDYMFRAVLQTNKRVLAGIVGALLHVDPESLDVEIQNPVILGQSFENKDFILDINVSINNSSRLNLEMQIVNYGSWKERSLSYLCRSFDNVCKGQDYITVEPVIQVSFIDFTLFPESPEFYATYMLQNIKTNRIYTDKLQLSIIELNSIALATAGDRLYKLDKWAAFFKAKTWKELKSMAATNQYMRAAANTIFELSSDENIRELCRRRAEFEAYERHQNAEIEHLKRANAALSQSNAALSQSNADKDLEIARLKELLASMQSDAL
ncbi:MAG: Rpn family recombination-promoting nuclease/putative transposase [Lachnospiraceae bacterium]|nr:Rpn family recombination-promoting nuclease/putative transposase [Lachnospiraceae bacterium]